MEVTNFGSSTVGQLQRPLIGLFGTLGSDRFDHMLGEIARREFHCDLITAFTFRPAVQPKAISIASDGIHVLAARKASSSYSEKHWQNDPSNIFLSHRLNDGEPYAVHMSECEVEPRHRQDIFVNARIKHQVSFVVKFGADEYLKTSFCRNDSSRKFTDCEVEKWAQHAELLTALLLQHSSRRPAERSGLEAAHIFSDKLKADYPDLTNRERAVCSLIAVGMTSTGIALSLGITVNTVLTFRRRAYARLNITSHGELLRLVL